MVPSVVCGQGVPGLGGVHGDVRRPIVNPDRGQRPRGQAGGKWPHSEQGRGQGGHLQVLSGGCQLFLGTQSELSLVI